MIELSPDEVHVWYRRMDSIPTARQEGLWRELLSEAETERYRRIRLEAGQLHFLAAHALTRLALSQYSPVHPKDWVFTTNQWGKPLVQHPGGAGLGFNISHTPGLVGCAVARNCSVGLDIENRGRRRAPDEIAQRFFAASETAHLKSLPAVARRDAFLRLWTLKEAYVKARGRGLAISLSSFAFQFAPGLPAALEAADSGRWSFFEFEPTPAHRMALSVETAAGHRWKPHLRDSESLLAL